MKYKRVRKNRILYELAELHGGWIELERVNARLRRLRNEIHS